jgi:hypothetical protein
MEYTIDEIKEILYQAYNIEDESDGEYGCFINGKWLSINDIIEAIDRGY